MKKTVLVVEDDAHVRQLLRDILEPENFEVVEAPEPEIALRLVAQMKVDLIITDRAMPGMSGIEFLKTLQEKKYRIPALMVSAWGEEKLWADAIQYGAQDYLLKPFNADDILRVVRKTLKTKDKGHKS